MLRNLKITKKKYEKSVPGGAREHSKVPNFSNLGFWWWVQQALALKLYQFIPWVHALLLKEKNRTHLVPKGSVPGVEKGSVRRFFSNAGIRPISRRQIRPEFIDIDLSTIWCCLGGATGVFHRQWDKPANRHTVRRQIVPWFQWQQPWRRLVLRWWCIWCFSPKNCKTRTLTHHSMRNCALISLKLSSAPFGSVLVVHLVLLAGSHQKQKFNTPFDAKSCSDYDKHLQCAIGCCFRCACGAFSR